MKKIVVVLLIVFAVGFLALHGLREALPSWPTLSPVPIPFPLPFPQPGPRPLDPNPCPGPGPCPPRPKRPHQVWGPRPTLFIGDTFNAFGRIEATRFTISGPEFNGTTVDCDLPADRHLKNKGGSDGAGLCVFTAADMAADWCGEKVLVGFRDWMTNKPGGGFPDKVREMIKQIAAERRMPEPRYLQVTNGDESVLEAAMKRRMMACVTYSGRDGVYYRQKVKHMVNLVCYDKKANLAAILDNNYPGKLLWMSCGDFLERWRELGGGWLFVLLEPGPPPVPTNAPVFGAPPMCPTCPPPPPPAIVSPMTQQYNAGSRYEWRRHDNDGIALYCDGQQIGAYRMSNDTYSTLLPGVQWKEDCPPVPVPREAWPRFTSNRQPLCGVVSERLKGPSYELNGKAVSPQMIQAAIDGELPDLKDKLWLVVSGGSDAERQQVINDLNTHPALSSVRNRVVAKAYACGEWPLGVGFSCEGSPTIQLLGYERPDGKAPDYGRLDSYPGAEQLATFVVEGLRQADPNYRPLLRPKSPLPFNIDEQTLTVIIGVVIVAFVFFAASRRR